jgi:DDE family transposase
MMRELIERFGALSDPRDPCKVEHRLIDILVIAVCAVIGEAESFEDIALYGRCKREWLKRFLALPNGIPSHDTFFRRVLTLIASGAC